MPGPFDRGWNRVDMYAASLVANSQIYNSEKFTVLDAIEEGEHHEWPGEPVAPATIVSITEHFVFVGVCGTQGWAQWVRNVLGSGQSLIPGITGEVAVVFGLAASAVWGNIKALVTPALATRRLVLIGHSLGGAVCQCLVSFFSGDPQLGTTCLCLGTPRVGDVVFTLAVSDKVIQTQNNDDPIANVPPNIWAGAGAHFPIPGPGPFAVYNHAGTIKTLDASGGVTDGFESMPFPEVVSRFITWTAPSHLTTVYAERLRRTLSPTDLTPANTGYEDPSMLDAVYQQMVGPLTINVPDSVFLQGGEMNRFTLFFNIGTRAGVTEDWYSDVVSGSWTAIINAYLEKRLACATSDFVFKYARISNVPATRKVSWRVASDFGNAKGTYAASATAAPEQALNLRLTMTDQSNARVFLHSFPRSQFDGENYTPQPLFSTKIDNFKALLNGANYKFQSLLNAHTPADRIGISAITPQAPRGCVITPATPIDMSVGDTIQIGGEGARILGLNGRKKIIAKGPGGATYTIGGAEPVGVPGDLAAGCYFYTCQFQYLSGLFSAVAGLTTHKVGAPFGVRPGRRENLIPLRQ